MQIEKVNEELGGKVVELSYESDIEQYDHFFKVYIKTRI